MSQCSGEQLLCSYCSSQRCLAVCGCLTHRNRQLPWTTVRPPLYAVGVVPWLAWCSALGIHHTLRCILIAQLPCEANRGYHVLCVYTLQCRYVSCVPRPSTPFVGQRVRPEVVSGRQAHSERSGISHVKVWVQAFWNFGSSFWPSSMYGCSELLRHKIVCGCVPHLLPAFVTD